MIKIGSHVSNSGEKMLVGALNEALSYNANCLMFYLGAPQNSFRKPLKEFKIEEFHDLLLKNNIDYNDVIIHAPYIVNLAQPDIQKREYAIDFIANEIMKVDAIGARYIVVHPGAHVGEGLERGLNLISDSLKKIFEKTKNTDVIICLETMAGKGTECCSKFEELKTVLENVNNNRLQICFDTCHVWDSGYNIVDNYEEVLKKFDELIGLDKIKVIHLNDSKNFLESHKDRHENIGFGQIGFSTLSKFVFDDRFVNVAKILETPYVSEFAPYKWEIEMLKKQEFDANLINKINES